MDFLIMVLAYFLFSVFINSQGHSGFIWGIFFIAIIFAVNRLLDQTLGMAIIGSLVSSTLIFYIFVFLNQRTTSRNPFIRFIREFDLYLAHFIYKSVELVFKFIRIFVKPKIKIYPGFNDIEFLKLKNYLNNKQWGVVENIINNKSKEARAYVIAVLFSEFKPNHYLDWIQTKPNSTLAYIAYGSAMVEWAWEARGSGTADTVLQASFETFYSRLDLARQAFQNAITLDDQDPEPFHHLITVSMGLGYPKEAAWEYFEQILKRDENHYFAHTALLTTLTQKWGGSEENMFVFARNIIKNLEKGSYLYALIAMAHIEVWLMQDEAKADHYFLDRYVIEEIQTAYQNYQSELTDNFCFTHYFALNIFAFCFYLGKKNALAYQVLKHIGKKATEYPWMYYARPILLSHFDTSFTFSKACKDVGL